jgi:hypothetical protein
MFCLFQFELLLCTQTDDDEAIHVVNRFRKKYPYVDCSLFTGKSFCEHI